MRWLGFRNIIAWLAGRAAHAHARARAREGGRARGRGPVPSVSLLPLCIEDCYQLRSRLCHCRHQRSPCADGTIKAAHLIRQCGEVTAEWQ